MLMYEELLKAYTAGADRYWLLNVGDIKPMEMEMQMFMDMAFNFSAFTYDNANKYQAEWLARVFGNQYRETFQFILDNYYRLAWDRKPEFMGYEMEWDEPEYSRLHDTDFSFETGTAQKRLVCYQDICNAYDAIEREVASNLRPALFEILGYALHSAYQMNRKFLYAQANHETGNQEFARMSRESTSREINRCLFAIIRVLGIPSLLLPHPRGYLLVLSYIGYDSRSKVLREHNSQCSNLAATPSERVHRPSCYYSHHHPTSQDVV